MSKTHIIIPDPHSHYEHNNQRAIWLGNLINDIRPDTVIMLGDSADMPSLSGFEKGRASFHGRTYRADINSHLDFNDRLWSTVKRQKKRLPYRVALEGNHEHRIVKALDIQPELEGTISLNDLEMSSFYDEFILYQGNTPGIINIDGIYYAHYMVSGVMGRAIGGEHSSYSLLTKQHASCTVGHTHVLDYTIRTLPSGNRIHGLVAGVFQDYDSPWAGECNKLWWRGCIIKRNVHLGSYDPQFVSIEWLKKEYS